MRGCFAICICGYHIVGEGFPLPSRRRLQTLAHLHIPPAPLSLSICKAKALRFATSVQIPKPRTIKNTLRFELHFRLCFGKADGADNLRLELLRGFRDSSRIAFFGTFFSKKKVHKDNGTVPEWNFRFDNICSFRFVASFRHFLAKMPPTLFSAKPARVLRTACKSPSKMEATVSAVPADTKAPRTT